MAKSKIAMSAALKNLRRYSPAVWLWLFAAGLLASIWFLTLTQLNDARSKYLHNAEKDVKSLARLFQEHTVRTFHSAAQITTFLEYLYQEQGSEINIHHILKLGLDKEIFQEIAIYDLQGDPLVISSGVWRKSWNPEDHFPHLLQDTSSRIYVTRPLYDPAEKKWAIYILRKITGANGQADAVVSVSMDPFYFVRLYDSVVHSPHAIVSLNGTDGIIRARISNSQPSLDQDITQTWLYKRMTGKEGSLRGSSVIDGRERLFTYRVIDDYPLSVVVALDVEEVLKPFEAMKKQRIFLAAIISLAILFFTVIISVMTRRLVISRENAIAANHAKTQFLSNMSHELRTPLNGILGYAELLTEYLQKGNLHTFAKSIHESGTHLLSLVNSILQLNKLSSGHTELVEDQVDIRKLVGQAVNAHAVNALAKGLLLRSKVDERVPENITCDRVKLLQVLNNLIHNAIKFTNKGGVNITVVPAAEKLVFHISDTGRGIPPAMQPQVFNKFFQVNAKEDALMEGAGLGLAIVKEVVHLMGGTISLQSRIGEGSTFTFSIPLATSKQSAPPPLALPTQEK